MVRTETPICDFGWAAPDFLLPGVDGGQHGPRTAQGPGGLLVMFICNHCPFVKAALDRILRDTRELAAHGVGAIAVMSNDTEDYPEDGWSRMTEIARERGFPFPYVLDADQSVARAYGAVCTPDFFGFNNRLELQYRGRLDAYGVNPAKADAPRELFEAMLQVARTGRGPAEQRPSVGCSIKWRQD